MAFRQELQPSDIDVACAVLEEYCLLHGAIDDRERDEIGAALVVLFQSGHQTYESLQNGLRNRVKTANRL